MTLGQRIAQKRKELGLSQEALGEQLGVSRQSIYKWEADSSLPEIEKLIALSGLFSVPVGWLLGVEDTVQQQKSDPQAGDSGELTKAQLKMVEEIVARYLAASPAPKKRRSWLYVLAAAAVIIVFFNLFSRLDQLDDRYSNLQNSVGNITYSVNSQIGGISDRVEQILKAQNDLTAEYAAELTTLDLANNAAILSAWAVPKTYAEGMTAEFVVDSGGEIITIPAQLQPGQKFTAEIICPLTDSITVSVVFLPPDGTRQTQLLDTYEYLLTGSFPSLQIHEGLHMLGEDVVDGRLELIDCTLAYKTYAEGKGGAVVESLKMGLFRNRKLVAWAEPCETTDRFIGFDDYSFCKLSDVTLENLTEEDVIVFAALVTDNFGRQFMAYEVPYVVEFDTKYNTPYFTYPDAVELDNDPANWIFE